MEEEQLFCQQEVQKTPKKEEKKAPKEISLLDSKTSMNVNIFLRQFKGKTCHQPTETYFLESSSFTLTIKANFLQTSI